MTPRQRALAGPMYGAGGPVQQSLAAMMGSPQAQEPVPVPPAYDPVVTRGQLLPIGRTESGDLGLAMPQMLLDAWKNAEQVNRYAAGQEWADPRETTEFALNLAGTGYASSLLRGAPKGGLLGQNVWHGGPNKWAPEPDFPQGRPRLDKIGTGEGAQAYGWGFYSADKKAVGADYREALTRNRWRDIQEQIDVDPETRMYRATRQDGTTANFANEMEAQQFIADDLGSLYHLDLPDEDVAKYLDWDAPLSEQPGVAQLVTDANDFQLAQRGTPSIVKQDIATMTGEDAYKVLSDTYGQEAASEALRRAGIPGLKYYDGFSRIGSPQSVANTRQKLMKAQERLSAWQNSDEAVAGQQLEMLQKEIARLEKYLGQQLAEPGTRNYVTWDQDVLDRVKILERDGETFLPMDEASRMARARDMGFDVDAYKGMPGYSGGPTYQSSAKGMVKVADAPWIEITEINSPGSHMGGGYAGFFSDKPSVANRFGNWGQPGAMVVPAKIRMENPVVIDMKGKHAAAAQFTGLPDSDASAIAKFKAALLDDDVDGVILKNTADEGTVYVPKNPNQIRSRFAKFDPAKIDSADILSSSGPPLGLLQEAQTAWDQFTGDRS